MPQTPMKARLAAGETLFGSFLTLGSPLAAEALGLAGWDWLLVDLEHGGGDESLLLGQLLALASQILCFVSVSQRGEMLSPGVNKTASQPQPDHQQEPEPQRCFGIFFARGRRVSMFRRNSANHLRVS